MLGLSLERTPSLNYHPMVILLILFVSGPTRRFRYQGKYLRLAFTFACDEKPFIIIISKLPNRLWFPYLPDVHQDP